MNTKKAARVKNEIEHFTNLKHIWWGAKTKAGHERYDRRFKLFKKLAKPIKSSLILEIGCGDGEFTKRLARLPSRIIATDITPAVVAKARNYFGNKENKNVEVKLDDSEKMSIKSQSVDIVCGISILHHIDYKQALKECFRVLRKGGVIFFSEPNFINPNIYFGQRIPFFRKKMEYSPDETALTRWRISDLLKEIGFSKVSVVNYDFLHPLTPEKFIGLVAKVGDVMEKIPLVKEISGSLIIWAKK